MRLSNIKCWCTLFLGAFCANWAVAQSFTYYLSTDTIWYMSGDRIIVTQEWSYPKEKEDVVAPEAPDRIAKLEKVSEADISSRKVDDRVILSRNIVYTCFDTGYYQIPPQAWSVDGDSIFSNPLFLNVYYAEVDTTEEIMDIEGPMSVPYTLRDYLPYIVGFGILMMLISAIYVFTNLGKKRKASEPVIERPPYIVAFEQLEELKRQKLWQQGEVKEYHFELSQIIREYLQRQFQRPTADLTTVQLEELCIELGLPKETVSNLMDYLRIGDLAKFAKAIPLPNENEESWDVVHRFVSETMRRPEDTNNEGENG